MKPIARLGFALLLAATALIPGRSEAAFCTITQCFANPPDCSQYVCPSGQASVLRCSSPACSAYCYCR